MNYFGAMLKRNRKLAGLTQEQLAEKLNVSTVAVQNWETGKNQMRPEKLSKLSYLFNIPLETLIHEILISEKNNLKDRFPYFLFEEDTNDIVRTLHLTLSQQELFGILYIYQAEFLERKEMDSANLREDLKLIPYEFISRFGSINLLNIAEGLYHVLKYVKSDFLVKVLRLNPEKEFDLCSLPVELICDFIDNGYKMLDETDWDADYEHALYFRDINMYKALKILPELEKEPVHITDGHWANSLRDDIPLWVFTYNDKLPDYLRCRKNEIPEFHRSERIMREWNDYHSIGMLLNGISVFTDYKENERSEWILSINETGKELLEWFSENKS
ncbi:MAG: helix-turn-helix domain-containing protein [Ruminococcus sp.]|nr:helix-turn-helix domain-containing protein [Ruminococcus sp.]